MRRLAKLLPYLAAVALALVALAAVLRSGPVTKHLRAAVTAELSRQTGRQVSIGDLDITLTGSATLRDLEVRDGGARLLYCPSATLQVTGLRDLLRGRGEGISLRSVKLAQPELTITRRASGELNISDLFQPKPGRKPFRATVRAVDGKLTFLDETKDGLATTLENLDITFRPGSAGESRFEVTATGTDKAFDSLRIRGRSGPRAGFSAEISVGNLDLVYASQRLPEVKAFSLSAGRGDVEAKVTAGPAGKGIDYHVALTVSGVEIAFPWLRRPAKEVQGKVTVENGDITLEDITGAVAEAPIRVSGEITGLPNPELALDISATGIRAKQIEELLPNIYLPAALVLPAPVRIQARAEGPVSNVVVTGYARTRVLKFHLIPWNEAEAKFRYSRGRLDITGLSAHGSPRRVEADMSVTWGDGRPRAEGKLHLKQVPMASLIQMLDLPEMPLRGLADFSGALTFAGRSPEVEGEIVLREAAWNELPLGTLSARVTYRDGNLSLKEGHVAGPSGRGAFSGKVTAGGEYDFTADLGSVPLRAVAEAVAAPALAQLPVETAAGRVRITPDRLVIEDLRVSGRAVRGVGRLELQDWREPAEKTALAGSLSVEPTLLSALLPSPWGESAGEISAAAEISLSGTRAQPEAEADLTFHLPLVSGLTAQIGRAHLSYQERCVYVHEAQLAFGGSQVAVGGQCSLDSGFDLELEAALSDLSLLTRSLRRRWGLVVEGTARAEARVTGPLRDPGASFQVTCEGMTINGKPVREAWLAGRYRQGTLRLDGAELIADGGRISAAGRVNLGSGDLELRWEIARLDLLTVQTIAYSSAWRLDQTGRPVPHRQIYSLIPRPLEGALSAQGVVAGALDDPQLEAHFLLSPVIFAGRKVETVCGDISASRRRVDLDLQALHQTAHASLQGFIEPQGDIFLSADIGNLDLRLLEPWLQWGIQLGGEGTINFDISGKTAQPTLMGDVHVVDLRLGPLRCEAAEAVPIRLDSEGTLSVEGIRLRDEALEGYGEAVLPIRLPGRNHRTLPIQGARAEMHIRKGSVIPLAGMAPITYDLDAYLQGNQLILGRPGEDGEERVGLRAQVGDGKLEAGGYVELLALRPDEWEKNRFRLSARLEAARLRLPGFGEARLDGVLELGTQPDTGRPILRTPEQHPVVVSDAELSLSTVGKRPPWRLAPLFSPDLRVRIAAGDNVWLRHGSRDRPTAVHVEPAGPSRFIEGTETGYLDIGGALALDKLTLDGRFESQRGVLAFPNALLTLRRGEMSIERRPEDPAPRISLRAEADGRAGDYYVFLNPEGQIYPPASDQDPLSKTASAPFRWNARSIPHLEEGYILALLGGPVAAPAARGGQDLASLLRGPGNGSGSGELTGIILPSLGGALGVREFSFDLAVGKPIRLRVGEKLFSRVTVSYVSALGDPTSARTVRIDYEIKPRLAVGWSVDESERTLWEIQSFVPF